MSGDRVQCLIVSPVPLVEARIGGIANFIRGFVRHAPDDFSLEIVGVESAADARARAWREFIVAGRAVRFFPVATVPTTRREGRIPTTAEMVSGILRTRGDINTVGRVLQFHAPATALPLLARRSPKIRVVHNTPRDLASAGGGSTWRHVPSVLNALENYTFRQMDRVFFVNEASFEQYAAKGGESAKRFRPLPNWVDTTRFRPLDGDERAATRARLAHAIGISPESAWVLYAGRLDPQKDPALLLRAFAAAAADRDQRLELLIVGDGSLRNDAERLAEELGISDRVHFLGIWLHERLAELMAAADLFVMSSAFEAAPFVIYESLAAGLPVVSTPVGQVVRLVEHGSTGWLADEHTPQALAAGIAWAVAQPRAETARRCAASMIRFNAPSVLAPFYDEHRRLAHRPASRD